jgi:nucleoside-diphosphate-sugar epimerase
MKILFIGGTGNISNQCSKLALEEEHEVVLLNRGKSPLQIPGARSVVADIKDEDAVNQALGDEKFDVVANFIAFTPDDIDRDFRLFADRAEQYIFISSASAYQKPLSNPVITESTPLKNPFWDYSRKKIACEDRLHTLYREEDFPMVIVRPSLTYDTVWPVAIGGWNDFTIVDRMRRGKPVISHGDGTSLWTVTHAADFAVGFLGLCGNPRAIGEAFHITSDEVLTWDQIYQTVAEVAGCKADIVHVPSDLIAKIEPWQLGNLQGDKAVSAIFDNSKIKEFVPEFDARISFREGAARTLAWFEEDPARQVILDDVNAFMDKVIDIYNKAWNAAG